MKMTSLNVTQKAIAAESSARIQKLLAALEVVLDRYPQHRERPPHVVSAIQRAAAPFLLTFG